MEGDLSIKTIQNFSFASLIVSEIFRFKVGRGYLVFWSNLPTYKITCTLAVSNFRMVYPSYLNLMECIVGYQMLFLI